MIARLTVGLSPDDPPINNIENEYRSNIDPPRLAGRKSILFRDVVFAVGAPRRILVDLAFAIRTRDGWLLAVCLNLSVVFIAIP
jgi:hypothetical protein